MQLFVSGYVGLARPNSMICKYLWESALIALALVSLSLSCYHTSLERERKNVSGSFPKQKQKLIVKNENLAIVEENI
jgi:hypothetical protein